MSNDGITRVVEAEKSAASKIENARVKAAEIVAVAREDVKRLTAESEESALKRAEVIRQESQKHSDDVAEAIITNAKYECSLTVRDSSKSLQAAVQHIVESVSGGICR